MEIEKIATDILFFKNRISLNTDGVYKDSIAEYLKDLGIKNIGDVERIALKNILDMKVEYVDFKNKIVVLDIMFKVGSEYKYKVITDGKGRILDVKHSGDCLGVVDVVNLYSLELNLTKETVKELILLDIIELQR